MNCHAKMKLVDGTFVRCGYRATMPSGFCRVHDPALKSKRDEARRVRISANPGPGKRRRELFWELLAACRRASPLMPPGTYGAKQVRDAIAAADKAIADGIMPL